MQLWPCDYILAGGIGGVEVVIPLPSSVPANELMFYAPLAFPTFLLAENDENWSSNLGSRDQNCMIRFEVLLIQSWTTYIRKPRMSALLMPRI